MMAQVSRSQGLSLAAPMVVWWDAEMFYSVVEMVGIGLIAMVVFLGILLAVLKLLKWCLSMVTPGRTSRAL